MTVYDVAIVGSGFAGSILARALRLSGRSVVLLERGAHPRFALGESSTPLGAIALERLGARAGLQDLAALASHGRWLEDLPHLRRGLKRGFTFYRHRAGRPYSNDAGNDSRLMVAASPDDAVADCQWLRADVDEHLVRAAGASGVDVRERFAVDRIGRTAQGWQLEGQQLEGQRAGERSGMGARFLVDASGGAQVVGRALGLSLEDGDEFPATRLLYGHFEGVAPFDEVVAARGRPLAPGPYPEQWSAVHHLLDVGWMYQLRFDHGTTSAGFVVRPERLAALAPDVDLDRPASAFAQLLQRYPSLEAQFGRARPERPIAATGRIQYRLQSAAGEDWALLPHSFCFFDPMFSTGIAWSLVAVERLLGILETGSPSAEALQLYGELLDEEASHVGRLVTIAHLLMDDFELFSAASLVYFAAASFDEARQRLQPSATAPRGAWAWHGFLGARDAVVSRVVSDCMDRSRGFAHAGGAVDAERSDFLRWLHAAIEPRDVAGLGQTGRNNLYPVDLGALVEGAGRLGMTAEAVTAALPRLRAGGSRVPASRQGVTG